jgi:hypothetical protein
METSRQLIALAALPLLPVYLLHRELALLEGQSGRCGENRDFCLYWESNSDTTVIQQVAYSLYRQYKMRSFITLLFIKYC